MFGFIFSSVVTTTICMMIYFSLIGMYVRYSNFDKIFYLKFILHDMLFGAAWPIMLFDYFVNETNYNRRTPRGERYV
jgi:hypothetical protein